MRIQFVKFNRKDRPEFFKLLKKRVDNYFIENNISKNANLNMVVKTIFMLLLYFTPLVLILTGVASTNLSVLLMWVIMGFGMSGIGLSVMHDANHGAYSKNKSINAGLGFLLNFLGGYHVNWKIQHNVLHHSFTNIHEFDEDINKGIIRMSPNQKYKKYYRFQILYTPILYGLMTIYWATAKDFEQLKRYNKKQLLAQQGLTFRTALFRIIFHKIWYMIMILGLPLMFSSVSIGVTILGFFIMHFIGGLTLALIFQPAHVIEETNFFKTDENLSVENNWAIHQLLTTSNFARESRLFSWFVGGLNYQIEHHLFPHICHVHYRNISKIVKATAKEYDIPYYEHKTFFNAVKSHFKLIYKLGTGKHDKNMDIRYAH